MSELIDKIMSEIESDPGIDAKTISLDVLSQGFLKKRKILKINGMVESAAEKNKILKIVKRQTSDDYDIADKLIVA